MIGVLMLVFMIGALCIWAMGNQEALSVREKHLCKLHSWVWDEVKEQRWCSVCNLVAGTVKTDNGDYE